MPGSLTPMMRQYLDLKQANPDCLLFFRLGDFYEMFFEDAVTASKELEIALTGRDCGLEERAPMCGVPYHSVDGYISRLIQRGYKVAICEQLTDPALSKGLVERGITRIITPGTVIEQSILDERRNNYIASILWQEGRVGLAYADVSTGSFIIGSLDGDDLVAELWDELSRIQPTEIIGNDGLFLQPILVRRLSSTYYLTNYGNWAFAAQSARERLLRHFQVHSLASFGCEEIEEGIAAAGALLAYLSDTQKNALSHIRTIRTLHRGHYMTLDAATRRNLELTEPIQRSGSKKNTLLSLLDRTETAMGGRMLRSWIDLPLQRREEIETRLSAISELHACMAERETLRGLLSGIYDIERLTSRVVYGTVNAKDCLALAESLHRLPAIAALLLSFDSPELRRIQSELDCMEELADLLTSAINEKAPPTIKEGNIIKKGYHEEVDRLRTASENGEAWVKQMQADERERTGIKGLKIESNRVYGYYIEVSKSQQDLVPYNYQRRQTLTNAERYITPELKELEETILGAKEKLIDLEYRLFQGIRETLLEATARLQRNAALIAALDASQSLADVAARRGYCRPVIATEGETIITDGRHPVVERTLKDGFIPNNTLLDAEENRLLILTGPNMAGKSTYMRQVALIVLMAHIGSFVPAKSARIVLTDRIFTRVGASDDLSAGQSTFMVEMSEMANILNNATSRSLLILDEIGRGTSTFDGLSIAWAVLEHIADLELCGAKALFATHYHELTELEGKLPGVKNYRIAVKEVGEDILFLRKIMRGGADQSFGIQVARLAGLPASVLTRAKGILKQLESADINRSLSEHRPAPQQQMTLFANEEQQSVLLALDALDVDALTPLEALNLLNDLHLRAKHARS